MHLNIILAVGRESDVRWKGFDEHRRGNNIVNKMFVSTSLEVLQIES